MKSQKSQRARAPAEVEKIGSRVAFIKRVKIKKIRSHKLYSEQERLSIWHTPEEYDGIKKRCIKTLKLMAQRPDFKDNEDYSSRGLEVRTKVASRARKETRAFASQVVLDEQENQDESGVVNPERIRAVYTDISKVAQNKAQFMAQKDREAIDAYTKDTQKEIARLLSR